MATTTPGSKLLKFLGSLLGTGGVDRTLHDKLSEQVSVKDFGAKGDGVTDDTAAIQNWINYVTANQSTGRLNAGNYKITSTLVFPVTNTFKIVGDGYGSTSITWAGILSPSAIIQIGDGTAFVYNVDMSGFAIYSSVKLTSGAAIKANCLYNSRLHDIMIYSGTTGIAQTLWDGFWFNGTNQVFIHNCIATSCQNDGLIVNGVRMAGGINAYTNLYVHNSFFDYNLRYGIHCAGDFGSLFVDMTETMGNVISNVCVDNERASYMNREIVVGANGINDGIRVSKYCYLINDSLANYSSISISSGYIGNATSHGIYIQHWTNSQVLFGSGRILNCVGDGVHISDSTTRVALGGGLSIDSNQGWDVNADVSTSNVQIQCQFAYNQTGDIASGLGNWVTTFTPTISSDTGSLGSGASATFVYNQRGKSVEFRAALSISTVGTASGSLTLTLPFAAKGTQVCSGRANNVTGKQLQATIAGSQLRILNYDNTFAGSNGELLLVTGGLRSCLSFNKLKKSQELNLAFSFTALAFSTS